jgi:hypothetical protein
VTDLIDDVAASLDAYIATLVRGTWPYRTLDSRNIGVLSERMGATTRRAEAAVTPASIAILEA